MLINKYYCFFLSLLIFAFSQASQNNKPELHLLVLNAALVYELESLRNDETIYTAGNSLRDTLENKFGRNGKSFSMVYSINNSPFKKEILFLHEKNIALPEKHHSIFELTFDF